MRTSPLFAGFSLVLACALTGCGSQTAGEDVGAQEQTLEVFAAASLTGVSGELEAAFEEEHPGIDLTFNLTGSSKLVQQMQEGASPDVLITADETTMQQALETVAGLGDATPTVIAHNTLVLATADGNPADIKTVVDLNRQGTITAICAAEVPCGSLAHRALEEQNIIPAALTEEANVSAVATKVATGEADAGFTYTTDAASLQAQGQSITVIDLPGVPANDYPMALTEQGSAKTAAHDFADWMNQDRAKGILSAHGFSTP